MLRPVIPLLRLLALALLAHLPLMAQELGVIKAERPEKAKIDQELISEEAAKKATTQKNEAYLEKRYLDALSSNLQKTDTWNQLAAGFANILNHQRAIECYHRSLGIEANQPSALHEMALQYACVGDFVKATRFLTKAIELSPFSKELLFDLGRIQMDQSQFKEAYAIFQKLKEIDPKYPQIDLKLGDVHFSLGQYALAVESYQLVLAQDSKNAMAYNNLACALLFVDQNQWPKAKEYFKQSLELDPTNPAVYHNLAGLERHTENWKAAAQYYEKSLSLRPNDANTLFHLASLWRDRKEYAKAENYFIMAIRLDRKNLKYKCALANMYMLSGKKMRAQQLFNEVLESDPIEPQALTYQYLMMKETVGWKEAHNLEKELEKVTQEALSKGEFCQETPFINLIRSDDPKLNLAVARVWSKEVKLSLLRPPYDSTIRKPQLLPQDKLTIGYLSCDFYDHPTAHLILGLFREHDKKAFNINVYSYGPYDDSYYRKAIEGYASRFVDISLLSDLEVAELMRKDGVDILVDLKGHTLGARLGIAAYKPAPIQITYLGFPGTSGAAWYDYILGDKIVTPESEQDFYTEDFLYMSSCYQINDNQQPISTKAPSREEEGLPDAGFVFASFNAPYKLDPQLYDCWMRLLKEVRGSVLWLYCNSKEDFAMAERNLKLEAQKRGVNPDRIILASRKNKPDHLARIRLADLILDPWRVNGHTTTSDALWAGVPVVTLEGDHFISRVSSSLLQAAKLKELVAHSPEEYEALCLRIAKSPRELRALKAKLENNRMSCPLFDTTSFAKELESHYKEIYEKKLRSDGFK